MDLIVWTTDTLDGFPDGLRGSSSDGVQLKSAQGDQTVPRKLAQLIYAIPA